MRQALRQDRSCQPANGKHVTAGRRAADKSRQKTRFVESKPMSFDNQSAAHMVLTNYFPDMILLINVDCN